jgi:hypothetical protein
MMARFLAFMIAMAAGSVASPAWAENFQFDVFLRGFRVGEVKFDSRSEGKTYKIQGVMGTRGFFGSFLATRYSGAVIGEVSNGRFKPQVFRGRFDQRRQFAQVDIGYDDNGPRSVTRTPPRPNEPHDVDPRSLNNVLDPITATYHLLTDVRESRLCRKNFRVYEGSRVSGIRLQRDKSDDPDTVSCIGNYTRIAGFTPDQMAERAVFPFRLNYQQLDNGRWRVTRFAMTTYWGTAQAVRVR